MESPQYDFPLFFYEFLKKGLLISSSTWPLLEISVFDPLESKIKENFVLEEFSRHLGLFKNVRFDSWNVLLNKLWSLQNRPAGFVWNQTTSENQHFWPILVRNQKKLSSYQIQRTLRGFQTYKIHLLNHSYKGSMIFARWH